MTTSDEEACACGHERRDHRAPFGPGDIFSDCQVFDCNCTGFVLEEVFGPACEAGSFLIRHQMLMLLIQLTVVVAVLGLLWWLVNQLPMPQPAKLALTVLFVLMLCLVLLQAVGVVDIGGVGWGLTRVR